MGMIWVKIVIPACLILNHHPILVDEMAALAIWDVCIELNLVRIMVDIAHLVVRIHLCDLCYALVSGTSATKMRLMKDFQRRQLFKFLIYKRDIYKYCDTS